MTRSVRVGGRPGSEGQILVIFAGGLVALLAVGALVVDIGFSFMLRRQEQNAVDPGAIAAARYIPTREVGKMWSAACFYAGQNGFAPKRSDNGAACVPGQDDASILTVNFPPSRAAAEFAGDPRYVEVMLTRTHNSFLAGVIGMPGIAVTSSAVAAYDDGTAGTSSLIALSDTACPSARIHGGGGGGGVNIFAGPGVPAASGGYVQINGICGYDRGANDICETGAGALSIDGGTTLTSNTVYIQGGCNVSGGSATINAPIDERASYVGDPLALVRPPRHTDLPQGTCPSGPTGSAAAPVRCNLNGTYTLQPGTYYGGWRISNSTRLTLTAGIYIIAGGGIDQQGGAIAASGRVLIYGTDSPACIGGMPAGACQQAFDFRGSGQLNLRGLDRNSPCLPYGSPGCPYGGLLFWQDSAASGAATGGDDIELEGSGSLFLEGTIYSAKGNVRITGNGLSTGCTPNASGQTNCAAVQIISDTWEVGGGGVLAMPYDPRQFYQLKLKGLVK